MSQNDSRRTTGARARNLAKHLAEKHGLSLSHTAALDALAEADGFRNRMEAVAKRQKHGATTGLRQPTRFDRASFTVPGATEQATVEAIGNWLQATLSDGTLAGYTAFDAVHASLLPSWKQTLEDAPQTSLLHMARSDLRELIAGLQKLDDALLAAADIDEGHNTEEASEAGQTVLTKALWLRSQGFVVGARDARLNPGQPGQFMVCKDYTQAEATQHRPGRDPWCIVGNDIDALIVEAFEHWFAVSPPPQGPLERLVLVSVTSRVDESEWDADDRNTPPIGEWVVSVSQEAIAHKAREITREDVLDYELDPAEEAALDEFHASVAIANLGNFEIECRVLEPGEEPPEDADWL